ncbi:MAG: hypothetical protein HY906_01890 [Deltaproteobacteria bacterium]|nr:hypothetical protein [Deltaproteobacteria bacterium]
MRLLETTPATIRELWNECGPRLGPSPYVDEVAAAAVSALYERFAESLVLARAFLTIPFQHLPGRQQAFATAAARAVGLDAELRPTTPVHSLLATRGCDERWNDARRSSGHVAIPLLSEAFVGSIPMMSRLLKALGLPLTWVQDPGAMMARQVLGAETGFFHVEDASSAIDELGRKIIPAQEFVARHAVSSVFAVGGAAFGGALLVLIFFSRDRVGPGTVRVFMPLVNLLKAVLIERCSTTRVFAPRTGEGLGEAGA